MELKYINKINYRNNSVNRNNNKITKLELRISKKIEYQK